MPPGGGDWLHPGRHRLSLRSLEGPLSEKPTRPASCTPCCGTLMHGYLKLLHPLPLHVLCLAEKLEALLALQASEKP